MTEQERSPAPRALEVIGTPLAVTSYEELTRFLKSHVRNSDKVLAIDLTNTHIATMRRRDPQFREITSRFDYFVPDGMPLIWCLNWHGAQLKDRVYGPTFMRRCILASPRPFTHYFLGADGECLQRLRDFFSKQNSAIEIVGTHHGYFGRDDEPEIISEINRLRPDFVWIGLGTPKQQDWIFRNKEKLKRGVLLAVGFAFDVNAGTKTDAPERMQRAGLTWLYRLLSEPRRLWKRYFVFNTLFLFYVCRDHLFRRP